MTCMYGLLQYSRIQFALVSLLVKFTFSTLKWNSTHLCSLSLFTGTLHQNWDNYGDSPWLLMIRKCCPYRPNHRMYASCFVYTTIYTTFHFRCQKVPHTMTSLPQLGRCKIIWPMPDVFDHWETLRTRNSLFMISSCFKLCTGFKPHSKGNPMFCYCVCVCMCIYFVFLTDWP